MPIYEYYCKNCRGESEHVFKIDDRADFIDCSHCGRKAKRVLPGRQGIQSDHPTWLPSANELLMPDDPGARHPETRGQFDKYLKDNNIVQKA